MREMKLSAYWARFLIFTLGSLSPPLQVRKNLMTPISDLRHVRDSDVVIWLVGEETTDPVKNEILAGCGKRGSL